METVEIARLCHQVGWRGGNLVVAVAVCLGESEGNERAFNGNEASGDLSYGLFQINMRGALGEDRRRRYGLSKNEDLFDPETNVRIACDIFIQAGHSFSPWGAFTSGGYKKFGRYEKAQEAVANMAYLAPALVRLRSEIDAKFPARSKASDGWIGDSAHSARRSDHNPDAKGMVHAIDITNDPAHGVRCEDLVEQLILSKDRRVKYIIWDYEIISGPAGPSPWVRRHYSGSNPHTKHMHISCVYGPLENDTSTWLEEEDMAQVPQSEWNDLKEKVEKLLIAITEKDDTKVKVVTGRATGSVMSAAYRAAEAAEKCVAQTAPDDGGGGVQ